MSLTRWPINHGIADVGTSVDDEVWRASHLRRKQHLADVLAVLATHEGALDYCSLPDLKRRAVDLA
jgi:hypothetical protein